MSDERATSTFPAGMARSGRGAKRDSSSIHGGSDPRRERPAFIVFGVFELREKYAPLFMMHTYGTVPYAVTAAVTSTPGSGFSQGILG